MRNWFLVCFITLLVQSAYAQSDSLAASSLYSLKELASLQWVKDSLTIQSWSLDMNTEIKEKFNSDSIQLKSKIDSLSRLNLPTEAYTSRLDSLTLKKQNLLSEVDSKQNELQYKTKQRLDKWKQKLHDNLTPLTDKASLPDTDLAVSTDINTPSVDLPEMPALSSKDFSEMELSPELSNINTTLPFSTPEGLFSVQEKISSFTKSVAGLKDLKSNPDKLIEKSVSKLDEVKELEKLGQTDNPLDQLDNPEATKDQLKKKALNHFAGKEQVLKVAMEEVSKYKEKYSSVENLKDLPKHTNPMQYKPFVERLVLGLLLHVYRNHHWKADFNPYLGYRLTSNLNMGVGYNYRLAFDNDEPKLYPAKVYGPRLYAEYDLFKGVHPRVELEWMKTFVPAQKMGTATDYRQWVRTIFVGLNKKYTINSNIKGTSVVMFKLFDPYHKSPYSDSYVVRLGLEFMIKKK